MSSLSGNAQRMYNSGIGKTEYTSVLFGFKWQHRLCGAALFFLRCRVLHGLAEKNYNEGMEGGYTMNVFKQLELTINAFCICLITIILLIPSLYFDSINIYIKGVFVNGPVAILLAIFIQLKIFYIRIRYHKDG